VCEPATEPAATIIDWSLDCPQIGTRPRPLAPATRARILAGLQRYGWAPITTTGAGNVHERTPGNRARPTTDPLPDQQTTATTALATPPGFAINTAHGGRLDHVGDPHPTVCAADDRLSLIVPLRNNGHATPTSTVLAGVTAGGNHHGLLMRNNTGAAEMITPLTEPARTMTTAGHQSLLLPYYGNATAQPVDQPLPTVPTRDRFALVDPDVVIDECGFRMLEPYEVAAAMAFPDRYIPRDLPKKDQVKLAGNAVTPPVMTWIIGRILHALEAAA
jgi:DNA (cytosine-5)-methyltransferase 1